MGIHRPHRYECQILLIVDHDTQRFTVEGPLYDHLPWIEEIQRARHAGRRIDFRAVKGQGETAAMQMGREVGYDCWPPRSIIRPAREAVDPAQVAAWRPQES